MITIHHVLWCPKKRSLNKTILSWSSGLHTHLFLAITVWLRVGPVSSMNFSPFPIVPFSILRIEKVPLKIPYYFFLNPIDENASMCSRIFCSCFLTPYLSALDFWHSLVWNFKFDELDFCRLHSSGSKNPVQTRKKIQFIKLEISNRKCQKFSADR